MIQDVLLYTTGEVVNLGFVLIDSLVSSDWNKDKIEQVLTFYFLRNGSMKCIKIHTNNDVKWLKATSLVSVLQHVPAIFNISTGNWWYDVRFLFSFK